MPLPDTIGSPAGDLLRPLFSLSLPRPVVGNGIAVMLLVFLNGNESSLARHTSTERFVLVFVDSLMAACRRGSPFIHGIKRRVSLLGLLV